MLHSLVINKREGAMDDRERIARLEVTVDKHDEQFARIDHRFDRLEDKMEAGFAEMRMEFAKTTRWLIGLTVAMIGIVIKLVISS